MHDCVILQYQPNAASTLLCCYQGGGFQTSFLATFRHVLASRDFTNEFLLIQESVKYCMNMHEQCDAPSWFKEHVLWNSTGKCLSVSSLPSCVQNNRLVSDVGVKLANHFMFIPFKMGLYSFGCRQM